MAVRPTPEQYHAAAVAQISTGVPLEAHSGPGDLVQEQTRADDTRGAYVTVSVWVTERSARQAEAETRHRIAAAKRALTAYLQTTEKQEANPMSVEP